VWRLLWIFLILLGVDAVKRCGARAGRAFA